MARCGGGSYRGELRPLDDGVVDTGLMVVSDSEVDITLNGLPV